MPTADEIHVWVSNNGSYILGAAIILFIAVKVLLNKIPSGPSYTPSSRDNQLVGAMDELRQAARERQQAKFEEDSRIAAEEKARRDEEKRQRKAEMADAVVEATSDSRNRPQPPRRRPTSDSRPSGRPEYNPLSGNSGGGGFRPTGFARKGGG
jgi:hypothetical protein